MWLCSSPLSVGIRAMEGCPSLPNFKAFPVISEAQLWPLGVSLRLERRDSPFDPVLPLAPPSTHGLPLLPPLPPSCHPPLFGVMCSSLSFFLIIVLKTWLLPGEPAAFLSGSLRVRGRWKSGSFLRVPGSRAWGRPASHPLLGQLRSLVRGP